jgi:transposase
MSTKEIERLSVIQKIIDKYLTQALGAQQLGLTIRQVKRLVRNYKQRGAEGLVSKQRGQVSNNKFSDKKIEDIKNWSLDKTA